MLHIKISESDLNYLLASGLDKNLIDSIKRGYHKKYDNIYLEIEKTIAQDILDFLGNELASKGLQQNDEPNAFGIMIENIIDKFSSEIYK